MRGIFNTALKDILTIKSGFNNDEDQLRRIKWGRRRHRYCEVGNQSDGKELA